MDLSPVQVARAQRWWADVPRLSFVQADAAEFLAAGTETFDAVYSAWGAAWYSDPHKLLPLVAKRLAPGGVFALSQAEPDSDIHGPQRLQGEWLDGRENELSLWRWQYSRQAWKALLQRHGFTDIDAYVLSAPEPGKPGTLMVRAQTVN